MPNRFVVKPSERQSQIPPSLTLAVPSVILPRNKNRRGSCSSKSPRKNSGSNSNNNNTYNDNNKGEDTGAISPIRTAPLRKASADSAGYFSGSESSPDATPVGFNPPPFSYTGKQANRLNQLPSIMTGDSGAVSAAFPTIPVVDLVVQAATAAATAALNAAAAAGSGVAAISSPAISNISNISNVGNMGTSSGIRMQQTQLHLPPPTAPLYLGGRSYQAGSNMPVYGAGSSVRPIVPQSPLISAPSFTTAPAIVADLQNRHHDQYQGHEYGQASVPGMHLASDTLKMSPCLRVEGSPCGDDLGNYAMHVSQ